MSTGTGVATTNRNINLSRSKYKYSNLKAQYKGSSISTDDDLHFKKMTSEQIEVGRKRAKLYLKRRKIWNVIATVLIITIIAVPILLYVYKILS